jgi:hypothetical protein
MRRGLLRDLLLAAVLLLLVVRLIGFVSAVGEESLQMDLSAFYTAGQAANAGLSPYVNHIHEQPPIWDGVDTYRHSRFLYPPLVARVFQPLAALPYHTAKYLWMVLSLVALGGALWIAATLAGISRTPWRLLSVGIIATAFYPLLTLLERGQTDSLTLLLLMAAVLWLGRPRAAVAAGVLLALATMLKLHCVFIVPFLLVRRQWRVLAGFAAGGAVLLLMSLAVDGYTRVSGYLTDELPRISRYGERGSGEMRLPAETLTPLRQMLATGDTVMDGHRYRVEYFTFSLNASAVRTPLGRGTWSLMRRVVPGVAPAQVSLVFLAFSLLGLLVWQRRFGRPTGPGRQAWELIYWQSVIVVILLCAPVSWVMGTVWLLPIAAIVLGECGRFRGRAHLAATVVCAAGLLLAGLPDPPESWTYWPFGGSLPDYRYVIAESVCLAGLLGLWRDHSAR